MTTPNMIQGNTMTAHNMPGIISPAWCQCPQAIGTVLMRTHRMELPYSRWTTIIGHRTPESDTVKAIGTTTIPIQLNLN